MSPRAAPVPAALAAGPFSRTTALAYVTDRMLRGPSYQPVLRGAHTRASQPVTHGVRIAGARRVLPPDAVLGGWSALWAWGVELAAPGERVEVVLPAKERVRSTSAVRVRGDALLPGEQVASSWGPVTSPARTAFDLGRRGGVGQSVPLLDALAHATGVTADDVALLAAAHRGARHVRRLPDALAEMDGRAESPRESVLRLLLVEAGFPRPTPQHTVRDAPGLFVARVDLAWPDLRVAVEYDGGHHDDPLRVAADRRRLNAVQTCGWSVVVVDRYQLRSPNRVVDQVRALRRAAGARSLCPELRRSGHRDGC